MLVAFTLRVCSCVSFTVYVKDNKVKAFLVQDNVLIWPVKGKIQGSVVCRRVANENNLGG
jgi:hypothetical protein